MERLKTFIAAGSIAFGSIATAAAAAPPGFPQAMDAAMAKMMRAMHRPPSGSTDRDFVNMMVPHHQGAIDMAVAELRFGRNPQLRRIAQEIIVEQQQEIAAMDLAVGEPLPPAEPAPTQQPAED
jgi:uncharacterized protein (DUF305 family)